MSSYGQFLRFEKCVFQRVFGTVLILWCIIYVDTQSEINLFTSKKYTEISDRKHFFNNAS